MQNQDKQITIAKLDGFTDISVSGPFNTLNGRVSNLGWQKIPDYFNSYDAIIPVILKQPNKILEKIFFINSSQRYHIKLTPEQLCDLLTRAYEIK